MKKIFALFSLLILSGISLQSFAINETDKELQNIDFHNNVTISFSDGTCCIAHTNPCEIGILQTWNVGDSIEITAHHSFKGLILINQNSDICYSPQIELTKDGIEKLPQIVKISKIRNENIDESNDRYILYLSLSDGSMWEYDLWSHERDFFESWKIGDRVLLRIIFDEAKIINYDLIFGQNYLNARQFFFKKTSE